MYPRRKLILLALVAAAAVATTSCSRTPEERYATALAKGKKLLKQKDYARAVVEFQNAAQAKPKKVEPLYWLGEAYVSQALFPAAVAYFRKATDLDPTYSPAQLRLADLMLKTHNDQLTKDAESRIQKILTENPADDDALLALAGARFQLGKIEDAEKYLNELVLRSPTNVQSAIALARVKLSARDFNGAEQVLKNAVQGSPNSPDAALALATFYAGSGRPQESEAMFRKVVQLDPKNAQALIGLAELQFRSGKRQEAENLYKAAAALPGTENHLVYAVFLLSQNRRPEAVLELERLYKSNGDDRIARTALVAGYLAADRVADAEAILNAGLKVNSKDLEALIQRSQIYLKRAQTDKAQGDIETILRFDPASAQGHYLMAKVYRAKNAPINQRDELAQVLRIAPESLAARFDLTDALLMANDPRSALGILDAAQQAQKQTLRYLLVRNWTLIAAGKGDEARKGVDIALAVAKTPEALLQDGLLKLSKQDFNGARAALEQSLTGNPEDLRPLTLLVQSYVAQKKIEVATTVIRQTAAKRPKSLPLQMYLAKWLLQNGQKQGALDAAAAAAVTDPNSPAPRLVMALVQLSDGKLEDARSVLNAVLVKEPKNVDAHMTLGLVEDAAKRFTGAIEEYKKVLEVDSGHIGALNNLAYDLARDQALCDEALSYAQKAKELAPIAREVQDTLGWVYYRKGLYDLAAKEFEGALANGGGAIERLHLGLAYNRLGKADRGGRLVAAALAEDPSLAAETLNP